MLNRGCRTRLYLYLPRLTGSTMYVDGSVRIMA